PPAVAPVDVFRERLDEPPPKPKPLPRPRLPVQPAEADSEFGGKATVGGGLLMMVIGAAWAGLAFWAGWISFYAILLFIGGLVAFIRGLLKKRGTD
ncbi:MAG: hypothetical protein ACJ8F7_01740, partial [Gemmataceae bacterium]